MDKTEVKKTEVIQVEELRDEPQCRHHWIIDTPHGAVSSGRCKICGERKEFFNSAPGAMWEDDAKPGEMGRWGRSKPATIQMDEDGSSSDSGVESAAVLV